jgi:ankyrin repeat protein
MERVVSGKGNRSFVADPSRCSALSAQKGHFAVLDLLLSHDTIGINNPGDVKGSTPLLLAVDFGQEAIVNLKLERLLACPTIGVNCTDRFHCAPLHQALAASVCHGVVPLLLSHDALDINTRDTSGLTPLALAVQNGTETTVAQLLAHKSIDIHCTDLRSRTLLHLTARSGRLAMLELLLSYEALELNARDGSGSTPLILAIRKGRKSTTKRLLAHPSIEVNCNDNDNWTALHCAAILTRIGLWICCWPTAPSKSALAMRMVRRLYRSRSRRGMTGQ